MLCWCCVGCCPVLLLIIQELIRKTKDTVVKEKEDEDARMKSQAKRLDYITRALRLEEMPVLRNKYEAQVKNPSQHESRVLFVRLLPCIDRC